MSLWGSFCDKVRATKDWVEDNVVKPGFDFVADMADVGKMITGDILHGVGYVAAESVGLISDDAKRFTNKTTEIIAEVATTPLKKIEHGSRIAGRALCVAADVLACDIDKFNDNSTELGEVIECGLDDIVGKPLIATAEAIDIFTGEDVADEATKLYNLLKEDAKQAKEELDKFQELINIEIDSSIRRINSHRKILAENKFILFKKLANSFAHWKIGDIDFCEVAKKFNYKMDAIEGKDSLMKIDFSNSPLSSYAKAFSTLGFWSRKEAQDSLDKVQTRRKCFEVETEKANTEKTRISVVSNSLEEVIEIFDRVHEFYDKLLIELEYSVIMMKAAYSLRDPMCFDVKIDLSFMPDAHVNCLMATDKMTRVMYEMGCKKYFNESKIENNQENIDFALKQYQFSEELQKKLAA